MWYGLLAMPLSDSHVIRWLSPYLIFFPFFLFFLVLFSVLIPHFPSLFILQLPISPALTLGPQDNEVKRNKDHTGLLFDK